MSAGEPPNVPPTGLVNPYSPPIASIDGAGLRPVEAGGYKSAAPLAKAITFVMALEVVAEIAGDLNAFVTVGVMRRVAAQEAVDQGQLTAIDLRTGALALLSLAIALAAVILFCFFMPRANRNARAFGSPMTITPGWAAGWFFIPIANLYKPFGAMKEIWQGSDPDPTVHAFTVPAPPLLKWWWGLYIAHNIAGRIVFQVNRNAKTASDLIDSAGVEIAASVLSIGAALLAAAVVRAVARRQDERQRRHPAGSPVPAPAPAPAF